MGAVDTTVFADNDKTYSVVGELPDGLELDTATGEITGTPAELGTFDFVVNVSVADGKDTLEYELPVTITVGGEVPSPGKTDIELLTERIEALEAALGDADVSDELDAIKADIAALEGSASKADLDALAARVAALETAGEEEGGCGSVVGFGIAGGVLAVALLAFVAMRKLRKDEE